MLKWITKDKKPKNGGKLDELSSMKAYHTKELKQLQQIISRKDDLIDSMLEDQKISNNKNAQERVFDMVEKFFFGGKSINAKQVPQPSDQQTTIPLESGMQYDDAELRKGLSSVPTPKLKAIINSGKDEFYSQAKKVIPNISDESLGRAYEIALEVTA